MINLEETVEDRPWEWSLGFNRVGFWGKGGFYHARDREKLNIR